MSQESSRPTKKQIMEIALDLIDFELHSEYDDRINALCIDAQTDDGKVFIEKKELDELREKAEAFDFLSEMRWFVGANSEGISYSLFTKNLEWKDTRNSGETLLDCVKQARECEG